jgi:GT2 family glycosyltransferase
MTRPDLSALVVNYNTCQLALDMLRSLAAQNARHPDGRPLSIEFVLVDNASPQRNDAILEEIRQFGRDVMPGQVILHTENSGYAGGMNLALEHASGEHIFVLNPDLVFLPGCVERLFAHLSSDPEIGLVGPQGYWEEGREVLLPPNILPTLGELWTCTFAHGSRWWNKLYISRRVFEALRVWAAKEPSELEMLSGACLMLRRSTIPEIGGLFDDAFPLYYEDTDLFRRVTKARKKMVLVPDAEIAHFYNRSGTTNQAEAMRRYWAARLVYYRKYYGLLGVISERLCRRIKEGGFVRRGRRKMDQRVHDLGDIYERPVLQLPRRCDHFLVEVCQDSAFLLAAGMFGSGHTWTPGESFWLAFGTADYYLRVLDLDGKRPEEIGVYHFRRIPAPEPEAAAAPSPAEGAV